MSDDDPRIDGHEIDANRSDFDLIRRRHALAEGA